MAASSMLLLGGEMRGAVSGNRHKPHVRVLPEYDADHQLANGFLLELDWSSQGSD